jgi:hypothetical protein
VSAQLNMETAIDPELPDDILMGNGGLLILNLPLS